MFTIYLSSPIGYIAVTGNEEIIASVSFVEESGSDSEWVPLLLQSCKAQLLEYFEGKRKDFSLPLAQSGTPFQQQVWHELVHIPYGNTCSYLDVAKSINNEKSTRAVGAANGKNQIAIIVPCHRVIGSNGALTGYAGGMHRKQWLLEHEAKAEHGVRGLY